MSKDQLNQLNPTDFIRDKAIGLFTYLRELTQLRSKVIRSLDQYEDVLWLSDIPREQECFTRGWGASRYEDDEIWIEIRKPKLPAIPSVPSELRPWVKDADLVDSCRFRVSSG